MARTLLSLWGLPHVSPKAQNEQTEAELTTGSRIGEVSRISEIEGTPKIHPFFAKRTKKAPAETVKSSSVSSDCQRSSEGKVADARETVHPSSNCNKPPHPFFHTRSDKRPPQFLVKLTVDREKLRNISERSNQPAPRPTLLVTLRADPSKMLAIKPRVHSFFAKRPRAQKSEISIWKPAPKPCPWPTVHSRSSRESNTGRMARRQKRHLENGRWDLKLNHDFRAMQVKSPRRLAVASDEVASWLLHTSSDSDDGLMDHLRSISRLPKAFDRGAFEDQLWTRKYAPQTCQQHIDSVNCTRISRWMQKIILKDEEVHPICLIMGPSGVGKTSAVFAAAKEQDCFVLEVNSTVRRSGRDLSSMLDGIGHSNAVHSNRVCVLVEEADSIFESEGGSFWLNLEKFAYSSNRPVILTSETAAQIPLSYMKCIKMSLAPPTRLVDVVWLVALSEGHVVDKRVLADAALRGAPLRDLLMHTQFWCQWGVGGSPSGVEWYRREGEPSRIFSVDTWIAPWKELEPSRVNQNSSIDDEYSAADRISATDRDLVTVEPALPVPERFWGLQSLTNYSDPVILQQRASNDILDAAPFVREMARADYTRKRIMEQHHIGRMTRRAWSTLGVDARQYLAPELATRMLDAWGSLA